jgi:hypothetical protein
LAAASALGLGCAWCPNTTEPFEKLLKGQCIEDYVCGNLSFYACIPPTDFIPPECPDNCTGNGICVNASFCKWIYAQPDHVWRHENGKAYTCDQNILNDTLARNQSNLCACVDGQGGLNCILAATPLNLALVGGIAAGILALIIVLAILGLALCGGGAYAATTAIASEPTGSIDVNPLYVGAGTDMSNPLFAA